jgi:hypothetical protein
VITKYPRLFWESNPGYSAHSKSLYSVIMGLFKSEVKEKQNGLSPCHIIFFEQLIIIQLVTRITAVMNDGSQHVQKATELYS